jgi:hypothetical protein
MGSAHVLQRVVGSRGNAASHAAQSSAGGVSTPQRRQHCGSAPRTRREQWFKNPLSKFDNEKPIRDDAIRLKPRFFAEDVPADG